MFKKDTKGFLSIIDGIFAILLLLIVFSLFNSIIDLEISEYSYTSNEFKDSQDIMELLSNKINFEDKSFLEEAEFILKRDNNSKTSIKEVSILFNNTTKELISNSNYLFTETNYLKGESISSSGDIKNTNNLSVAKRNVGNYSFILYMW